MRTVNLENYSTLQTQTNAGHLTDRYKFVPTSEVVNVLQDYGWQPVSVKQAAVRAEGKDGFQKHIVRLENPSYAVTSTVDSYAPQIVLTNSHNGSGAFKLQMGVFRLVCLNGMVTGDTYATETIRHVGFATDKVESAARVMADSAPRVISTIQKMQDIELDPSQYQWLAHEAVKVRFPELTYAPYINWNANAIGVANRRVDEGLDLWKCFNRMQENCIRGHRYQKFYTNNEAKAPRRLPTVNNIGRDLKINSQLWDLAEAFVN